MGKQTVFIVIFGSVVCWKYGLRDHVKFSFPSRVNLIHNQTLQRPSWRKERSDSARPEYMPSKNFVSRVAQKFDSVSTYQKLHWDRRVFEYWLWDCWRDSSWISLSSRDCIWSKLYAGFHWSGELLSVYYRVSWNWSYVRLRDWFRP